MIPLVAAMARSSEQRAARARALRIALGSPSGWAEDARHELAERVGILTADGVPEAERVAEECVRAALLRRAP